MLVKATVTPNPSQPPQSSVTVFPESTCVNVESPLRVTGTNFHSTLESLNKFKLKREIEAELLRLDGSTKEQRASEEKMIAHRIYRIDLLITSLIFYTSLVTQWLTLVGLSTSFPNFLYEVFIGSFNFPKWNFSDIQTVGKISGVTTSSQVALFIISNLIIFFYETFHHTKSAPSHLSGPTYFGGPFQLFNVLRAQVHEHNRSVKKLDAKLSRYLGIASQILIIVTAIITISNEFPIISEFARDIQNFDFNITFTAGPGTSSVEQGGSTPQDVTQADSAKHAALFARTTLIVSILAIIMTSLLNIVTWLTDVWKTNQDEIIAYEVFKWITRLMVCAPCCGERSLDDGDEEVSKEIDELENASNLHSPLTKLE